MNPDSNIESSAGEVPKVIEGLRNEIASLERELDNLELETSHQARDTLELVIHSLDEIIIAESEA